MIMGLTFEKSPYDAISHEKFFCKKYFQVRTENPIKKNKKQIVINLRKAFDQPAMQCKCNIFKPSQYSTLCCSDLGSLPVIK